MRVWFTRSNGTTVHNNPETNRYVEGEPPTYPDVEINYREVCLSQGFARIGWPGTGDTGVAGWEDFDTHHYTEDEFTKAHRSYLKRFSSIQTGDLVVIPADRAQYDVHLGRVVVRDRTTRQVKPHRAGQPAYYYHFNVQAGDWLENAHRIDAVWARDTDGQPAIYHVPALGGAWLRAFAQIHRAKATIEENANDARLMNLGP